MGKRKTNDEQILRLWQSGLSQLEISRQLNVSPACICKRLKRLLPAPDEILDRHALTDNEKRFVIEKASGKNNTQAAIASHEVSRASAKVIGCNLMKKPEVQMSINELMETYGLTRSYRINRLRNHIDHKDPLISLRGLDMSFRLDGSYAPDKHQHQVVSWSEIVLSVESMSKAEEDEGQGD